MKLLHKTNFINIIVTTILLVVGGIIIYLLITTTLKKEIDEKLSINKERIVDNIEETQATNSISPIIEIQMVDHQPTTSILLKDTFLFDPVEKDRELFRELTSFEYIDGKLYKITVRQAILEPHDYFNNIGFALLIVWVLLLAGFLVTNWGISKKIWRPFHKNLKALKDFKVGATQGIELEPSDIKEFKELNIAIAELTERVQSDYNTLKDFSENAAHEMQTPLAIIQAKLEDALQSPELSEKQALQIHSSLSAAKRLSDLNKSLVLLAKIENRQFDKKENVHLSQCIENMLEQFLEYVDAKDITVEKELEEYVLPTNRILLEVLLSNLISNAIKYNLDKGTIRIDLKDNILCISNPSKDILMTPDSMFNRFTKANQSSQSLGLGLSIVKKICEIQGWTISYTIKANWHFLKIQF